MSGPADFLSRWSRRKAGHRQAREAARGPGDERAQAASNHETAQTGSGGERAGPAALPAISPGQAPAPAHADAANHRTAVAGAASPAAHAASPESHAGSASAAPAAPDPQAARARLPPLGSLTPDSDFRPFMQAGVDPATRSAALRRLFADPHFNQMDGMDVYIDDYGKPDPIPDAVLRALNQARDLGLFDGDAAEVLPDGDARDTSPAAQARSAPTPQAGACGPSHGNAAGSEPPPAPGTHEHDRVAISEQWDASGGLPQQVATSASRDASGGAAQQVAQAAAGAPEGERRESR